MVSSSSTHPARLLLSSPLLDATSIHTMFENLCDDLMDIPIRLTSLELPYASQPYLLPDPRAIPLGNVLRGRGEELAVSDAEFVDPAEETRR